ncbi:hypothetical protein [Legionella drozanskii]|uniref:Uncharacterized protein n=1 Tax=Legionella drozanskii LLAP-1 TaxID=1212489 RepID=A0A0W0T0Q7_9GAMM|nr:hypothetical protein [Legionella drozanskii]KTC89176.1 hypothetical protein Ldro_0756 [Legionella drozanskii LLAP-1]
MKDLKSGSFNEDLRILKNFHDLSLCDLERITEISNITLQSWLNHSNSEFYQKLDATTFYYIKSRVHFDLCERGSLGLRSEVRFLHTLIHDTLTSAQKELPNYKGMIEEAINANLILLAKMNEIIAPDNREKEFYEELNKEMDEQGNVIYLQF